MALGERGKSDIGPMRLEHLVSPQRETAITAEARRRREARSSEKHRKHREAGNPPREPVPIITKSNTTRFASRILSKLRLHRRAKFHALFTSSMEDA